MVQRWSHVSCFITVKRSRASSTEVYLPAAFKPLVNISPDARFLHRLSILFHDLRASQDLFFSASCNCVVLQPV